MTFPEEIITGSPEDQAFLRRFDSVMADPMVARLSVVLEAVCRADRTGPDQDAQALLEAAAHTLGHLASDIERGDTTPEDRARILADRMRKFREAVHRETTNGLEVVYDAEAAVLFAVQKLMVARAQIAQIRDRRLGLSR